MAIYTVQDTTMTALGDAVRKQVIGTTETVFSYPEKYMGYNTLYVIKLPSFAKKAKIVGKGYHKTHYPDGWAGVYQGLGIATGEYDTRTLFWQAEDYQKVIDNPANNYIDTPIEFEVIVNSNIFTFGATFNASNSTGITIIFDVIALDENGNEFKYTPAEMVEKIDGLITVPEKAFTITGVCSQLFANNKWKWFIDSGGSKITTKGLTAIEAMFQNSSYEYIPFDLNMDGTYYGSQTSYSLFQGNGLLKIAPMINNLKVGSAGSMFKECWRLRSFPEGFADNWDFSGLKNTYSRMYSCFENCYSLRKAPQPIISNCSNLATSSYSSPYESFFENCYCLDEINGFDISQATLTSNMFVTVLNYCSRLKDFTFAVNEDGTPKTANWKGQSIDLASYIGYAQSSYHLLNYNSGITADKEVIDDATYQALKNDPDWFSCDINYSRYNHDSAVNTINSLPDCSSSGGTNTIKFKGAAGALTDGGAINTLTEEEIAVASAKGWTVSLV